jgi:hypothetical protein
MEFKDLQELLIANYIYINHTSCGYTWGMISNMYYEKPSQVFDKLVTHINSLLGHNELRVAKTDESVVCYTIYHCETKLMSFYKTKAKKSKHGIFIINDNDALDIIFETIR